MKMMKTLLFGMVLTTSVLAQTHYKPYVSINLGGAYLDDSTLAVNGIDVGNVEFDSSIVYEGAIGVKVDQGLGKIPFRAEVAGFYQKNDVKSVSILGNPVTPSGDVALSTVLLNGYFDFPMGHGFAPYVLGGFGYGYLDANAGIVSESYNLICGQIGAGLGYSITDHLIIDLRYKYFMTQNVDVSVSNQPVNEVRTDVTSQQVLVGLRYEF
jgi:opacity protein-like surface antigen